MLLNSMPKLRAGLLKPMRKTCINPFCSYPRLHSGHRNSQRCRFPIGGSLKLEGLKIPKKVGGEEVPIPLKNDAKIKIKQPIN